MRGRRRHVVAEGECIPDGCRCTGGRDRCEGCRREDVIAEERRTHRRTVSDAAGGRVGGGSEVVAHSRGEVEGFRAVHSHVLLFLQLNDLTETAFVFVVNEMTTRSVGAEAYRVKGATELRLVLGVAGQGSQLRQAVGKLALVAVFTMSTFFEWATQFRLVTT